MASSFVRFGDHGFWVSDWVLEYWLHFLANEVDKVSQAPLWLQEAGQHWRIQSARICVGCVDVGLDEYATTPERKAALVAIGREAQRTLQSLDEEEEISLESGSLPASDLPVGEIMDLAVQFVRLLGGDVTSPMSSEDVYRVIQRSTERGKATAFLGHSPLAQPKDVFTFPRYRRYIREATRAWWRAREKYLADRPGWGRIRESLKPLLRQYIPRLPIYLLARCPICEGNVSESVDTFSFNGFGWRNKAMEPSGRGWFGVTRFNWPFNPSITYRGECDHVRLMLYGVNLNGEEQFHDIFWDAVFIGSERPYVIPPLLDLEDTYAVMHRLPLGRLSDRKLTHRHTIYFSTYFTDQPERFERALVPYRSLNGPPRISPYAVADYDLAPWVRRGRLLWLDDRDPNLDLRGGSGDLRAFPYQDVEGREGRWCLTKHRSKRFRLLQLDPFSDPWLGYR